MRSKNIHFIISVKILIVFVFASILFCPNNSFPQKSSKSISMQLMHLFEHKNHLPYKAKFSVDGKFLICESFSGSFDSKTGKLRIGMEGMEYLIYDVMNNQVVSSLIDTKMLGFNYRNDYLVEKDGIVLCNFNDGTMITKISETPGQVVLSSDGKYAAVILSNEKIFIYDFITNQKLEEYSVAGFKKDTGKIYLIDNKTLLQLLKNDSGLVLKDIIHNSVLNNYSCNNSNLVNVAYAPNGIGVAASSKDSIYVWNILDNNSLTVRPFPHEKGFNAFNYSRDGMLIGAGSASMDLLIYDRVKDELNFQIGFHAAPITDVVFSPVDNIVVTTSFDGTMKVWTLEKK